VLSSVGVDPVSPDGDPAKFRIAGQPARAIHHFSGWHVPINLTWFQGAIDPPMINGSPFYWYAFALPPRGPGQPPHYFICDYLQMREWVLDFDAPRGVSHQDHRDWRADLRVYSSINGEHEGYFRWGDEAVDEARRPGRVFELDNIATVLEPIPPGARVGTFAVGGESAAHKLLKLWVAEHPLEFGLSAAAIPVVEYPFATGDRVDVLFQNHQPDRTVVEVEVEGEQNVCVGIQQAIKYRTLAAVDAGYPLLTGRVRSLVVAYSVDYPKAMDMAERYEVTLASVDREVVLAGTS
jgi:hypothetical protein